MEIVVVAGAAILVGTVLQRLSGTGVGLVVAPVLAILIGPVSGILVTNATTVVSAFLIMLSVRREVEWRRFFWLLPGAIAGALSASLIVRVTPAGWLQLLIGAVVLIALATTFGLPNMPVITSRAAGPAAGIVGGFFNTTAGVAAPVMVIYAKLSQWSHRPFAATMQPTFMSMGIFSIAGKVALGATSLSELPPWWVFLAIVGIVVIGIGAGSLLAGHMSSHAARMVAIVVAALGGLAAATRGILSLVG